MKKAQGLSMNVIIIAAISLLVLVILATFLLRSAGEVNEGTACEGIGGSCTYAEDGCEQGFISAGQKGCDTDMICCIPITHNE